jgi:predicted TPR repeat methyltransferase
MKVFKCRLCSGPLSKPKLDLGSTPLANELLLEPREQETFPLQVCLCEQCEHYQLNESVSPERLFRDYLYVTGTSKVNLEHFRKYAKEIVKDFNLQPGNRILEIASNDGSCLKEFLNLKMSVLGIDPARNLAEQANKEGIPTISEFFTEERAMKVEKQHEQFHLITANNVFAHVPDLLDFAKGVRRLLKPNGIFSFEVSYFADVCRFNLFDTIYMEHSSYHTIKPLISFFEKLDMMIFDIKHLWNHGGSIRVFVCHQGKKKVSRNVQEYITRETDIPHQLDTMKNRIETLSSQLNTTLHNIKYQNKSIAIYGFPAKATTLFYSLDIDASMIDFVVDDAVLKIGRYTPGKHIPILYPSTIYEKNPDYLLVLAWNFADSIIEKHKEYKGKWIIPLPTLEIV